MSVKSLLQLGDRNELIIQLRLLHNRRQTNQQEFRLQFQRNTQRADMFKQIVFGYFVMHILTSGYVKLDVDNDVLFVKFIAEKKVNFYLILFISDFLLG